MVIAATWLLFSLSIFYAVFFFDAELRDPARCSWAMTLLILILVVSLWWAMLLVAVVEKWLIGEDLSSHLEDMYKIEEMVVNLETTNARKESI